MSEKELAVIYEVRRKRNKAYSFYRSELHSRKSIKNHHARV